VCDRDRAAHLDEDRVHLAPSGKYETAKKAGRLFAALCCGVRRAHPLTQRVPLAPFAGAVWLPATGDVQHPAAHPVWCCVYDYVWWDGWVRGCMCGCRCCDVCLPYRCAMCCTPLAGGVVTDRSQCSRHVVCSRFTAFRDNTGTRHPSVSFHTKRNSRPECAS
jgi:hypothetical protein